MNKQRAIQIITRAAELYKNNLEDQKILFLYGIPSVVKKDLQTQTGYLPSINSYEVAFHRCNFLHLTGVKLNTNTVASSIHFYEKCIKKRLTENDFSLAKNGSTAQKLDILENMMLLKKSISMIGEFTDKGPQLFTEKVAGNICGCIGFIQDKNTRLNVPNTLLKKDIRDVTASPTQKVFGTISKQYIEAKYSNIIKLDKCIDIMNCRFSEQIENLIKRT